MKTAPDSGANTPHPIWTHIGWRVAAKAVLFISSLMAGALLRFWGDLPVPVDIVGCVVIPMLFLAATVHELLGADLRDKEKSALRQQVKSAQLDGARDFAIHVNGLLIEQVEASDHNWDRDSTERYIRAAVTTTKNAVGVDRARACLFEYDPYSNDGQPSNDEPMLIPMEFGDSLKTSKRKFTNETEHGRDAIKLVQNHEARLVENVNDSPEHAVDPNVTDYETFIAASAHWKGKEFGMLTVDAPETGQLTESQKEVVMLLAKWIGVGLYHKNGVNAGSEKAVKVVDSWTSGTSTAQKNPWSV